MNIFILSENPIIAAQSQCDKHVVKMIVESAQMLSTAHRLLDGNMIVEKTENGRKIKRWVLDSDKECILYKSVHVNHPCTQWTAESSENYKWLYNHFIALCDEYTYRYDKIHNTYVLLKDILSEIPGNILHGNLTPFALAMKSNPECICHNDPVASYRNYYLTKRDRFKMVWTKRKSPVWWI